MMNEKKKIEERNVRCEGLCLSLCDLSVEKAEAGLRNQDEEHCFN